MQPKVLKLKEAIKFGSEDISELTIRAPKAKDIRGLPAQPNTGDILNLAAKLCGQTPSVIDELGMEDTVELLEIVGNFMAPGRVTGSQS